MEKLIIKLVLDPATMDSILQLIGDINNFVNQTVFVCDNLFNSCPDLDKIVSVSILCNLVIFFKVGIPEISGGCLFDILYDIFDNLFKSGYSEQVLEGVKKSITLKDFIGEPLPRKPLLPKSHFCFGLASDMLHHLGIKCSELCSSVSKSVTDTFDWIVPDTSYTVSTASVPTLQIHTWTGNAIPQLRFIFPLETIDPAYVLDNLTQIITSDNFTIRIIIITTLGNEILYRGSFNLTNGLQPLVNAVNEEKKQFFINSRRALMNRISYLNNKLRRGTLIGDINELKAEATFRHRAQEQVKAILESILKSREDSFSVGELVDPLDEGDRHIGGLITVSLSSDLVEIHHDGNRVENVPTSEELENILLMQELPYLYELQDSLQVEGYLDYQELDNTQESLYPEEYLEVEGLDDAELAELYELQVLMDLENDAQAQADVVENTDKGKKRAYDDVPEAGPSNWKRKK